MQKNITNKKISNKNDKSKIITGTINKATSKTSYGSIPVSSEKFLISPPQQIPTNKKYFQRFDDVKSFYFKDSNSNPGSGTYNLSLDYLDKSKYKFKGNNYDDHSERFKSYYNGIPGVGDYNTNNNFFDNTRNIFKYNNLFTEYKLIPEINKSILNVPNSTKYNPYERHGDLSFKGKYRPIGVNRNDFVTLTHIRPYVPDEIKCLEWIALGSCAFNVFLPQYARVNDSPKYLKDVTTDVSTENFYWQNRLIGALADPHYNEAMVWIDRYQNNMASKGHELINKFDKEFMEDNKKLLENNNEEICKIFKKETTDVLGKVLHTASLKMKNAFSRSDA